MHEDRTVRIPEEIRATTGGLSRVALIAVAGFAAMAWMSDDRFRTLTFAVGVMTVGVIAALLLHLRWQLRYGPATLFAPRPFEMDKPFSGTIVTALQEVPRSPIRIRLTGWSSRSEVTLGRTTVDPMHLRRGADGSLAIPFHIPEPEELGQWRPREIRLRVRTAHWPLGWGTTFLIIQNP